MLASLAAQAPAMTERSRGWSGARMVISVAPSKAIGRTSKAKLRALLVGLAHEGGVAHLPVLVDAQPVGGVVQVEDRARAPPPASPPAGAASAARASARRSRVRRGAEAAGQDRLGLEIERPQKLALPAVPDAGADRADVADGEHQEQLQPLHRLHDLGEIEDGAAVGQVARLGDARHGEVLFDQPGDELGLVRREPEPGAEPARHLAPATEWSSGRPLAMSCRKSATASTRHVLDRGQDRRATADGRRRCRPVRSAESTPIARIRCSSTV